MSVRHGQTNCLIPLQDTYIQGTGAYTGLAQHSSNSQLKYFIPTRLMVRLMTIATTTAISPVLAARSSGRIDVPSVLFWVCAKIKKGWSPLKSNKVAPIVVSIVVPIVAARASRQPSHPQTPVPRGGRLPGGLWYPRPYYAQRRETPSIYRLGGCITAPTTTPSPLLFLPGGCASACFR